jgi:hypothetical protein
MPLKNKMVYNDIVRDAASRSRIPFFFIVNGCLSAERMVIIDKKVKENRRKVSVIGEP